MVLQRNYIRKEVYKNGVFTRVHSLLLSSKFKVTDGDIKIKHDFEIPQSFLWLWGEMTSRAKKQNVLLHKKHSGFSKSCFIWKDQSVNFNFWTNL